VRTQQLTIKIPPTIFEFVYQLETWQKLAIFAISWLIPIVIFWFLFLGPKIEQLNRLNQQIPRLEAQVNILEAKAQQLPLIKEELNLMQQILKRALQLLPTKKDIPSVLTQISTLGNECHLEFISFQPKKEKIKGFYAAIPVSIVIEGPFHNTLTFFDKVTRMARIVHIKSVNMGGAKQSKAIWSQTVSNKVNNSKSNLTKKVNGQNQGIGGSWIIKTTCQAVTYRFLTKEEFEQLKKRRHHRKH